jgi:hypothetical protein
MELRRALNIADSLHDFGKGTRVSEGVRKFTKEYMLEYFMGPSSGFRLQNSQYIDALHKGNIEETMDALLFGEDSTRHDFSTVHTAQELNMFLNAVGKGHRNVVEIKYTDLERVPAWLESVFVDNLFFTLDVTLLPEELLCEMVKKKIEKTLAYEYDRNAIVKESGNHACVEVAHRSISLSRAEQELLQLDVAQISTDASKKTIEWKLGTLMGTIDISKIATDRKDDRNLTLFGNAIQQILHTQPIMQGGVKTVTATTTKQKQVDPLRRVMHATPTAAKGSKKLAQRKGVYQACRVSLQEKIQSLYGLPPLYNMTEGKSVEERLALAKVYVGCLMDFKRMGDLLQIKIAKDRPDGMPENVFVTNDIVTSIMAAASYGIPTIRSGKTGKKEGHDHSNRLLQLYNVNTEGFLAEQVRYHIQLIKEAREYVGQLARFHDALQQVEVEGMFDRLRQSTLQEDMGAIHQGASTWQRVYSAVMKTIWTASDLRIQSHRASVRESLMEKYRSRHFPIGLELATVLRSLLAYAGVCRNLSIQLKNMSSSTFQTFLKELDTVLNVLLQVDVDALRDQSEAKQREALSYVQGIGRECDQFLASIHMPPSYMRLFRFGSIAVSPRVVQEQLETMVAFTQRVIDIIHNLHRDIATTSKQFEDKTELPPWQAPLFNFPPKGVLDTYKEVLRFASVPSLLYFITTENVQQPWKLEVGLITNHDKYHEMKSKVRAIASSYDDMYQTYGPTSTEMQGGAPSVWKTLATLPPMTMPVPRPSVVGIPSATPQRRIETSRDTRRTPVLTSLRTRQGNSGPPSWDPPGFGDDHDGAEGDMMDLLDVFLEILAEDLRNEPEGEDKSMMTVLLFQTLFLRDAMGWSMPVFSASIQEAEAYRTRASS